jgi:uncharacterized protein (DUF433 family)
MRIKLDENMPAAMTQHKHVALILRVRSSLMEILAMPWQDRITVDPDVLVGEPIVKGTRISVEFVLDLLARGWTTAQVLREYDHLTPEDVQACLAYAGDRH